MKAVVGGVISAYGAKSCRPASKELDVPTHHRSDGRICQAAPPSSGVVGGVYVCSLSTLCCLETPQEAWHRLPWIHQTSGELVQALADRINETGKVAYSSTEVVSPLVQRQLVQTFTDVLIPRASKTKLIRDRSVTFEGHLS